ncbi:hypothetical protein BDU57DRAFT_536552 [Ampelomyces quisqualis]|uniref:Uncharacterized protein n=1 Tax=Ampelomyces quisqualis TaxID=50730 RepID=A0A6A5QXB5_AMPQU|nr:hypothetical protein BDU57DRAFT_536552 [Ampelomyces quisqualis]
MLLKKAIMKVRRAILCCRSHKRKPSLDIGSPTNVRHVPITDSLPGLTDSERLYIREKASSDAIHLLGLHTSPPSPTGSNSPLGSHSPSISSPPASRENSLPLLNAASKDLPEALPTPPRPTHGESSPPRTRMQGMSTWDFVDEGHRAYDPTATRLSLSSAESGSGPRVLKKINLRDHKLSRSDSGNQKASERRAKKDANQSFMSLNFGFDWELDDARSTASLGEGFEMQDTVGGHTEPGIDGAKKGIEESVVRDSDSEADVGEMMGLVKI